MAVALVTSTTGSAIAAATATSGAINTTGATLLVAVLLTYDQTPATGFSDSKGNSWSYLTVIDDAGGSEVQMTIAYAYSSLSVGSGHTFSYNSGSYPGFVLFAFSGTETGSDPFDGQQNGGAFATGPATYQPGSITPAANGAVVILGIGTLSGSDLSYTVNGTYAAMTEVFYNSNLNLAASYDIQTTATATNPTVTPSSNARETLKIASFKAATGGGGDVTPPTLGSREVPTGGVTLTGTLNESCTPSSGTGGFTLAGTAATVASWAIAGGTALTLTLSGTVYSGETVTLSYDRATTTDDIQDASGNFLANFSAASVTNSSTQVAPSPAGGSVFRSLVISRGRPL